MYTTSIGLISLNQNTRELTLTLYTGIVYKAKGGTNHISLFTPQWVTFRVEDGTAIIIQTMDYDYRLLSKL